MKSIEKFCQSRNLTFQKVTFKYQGIKLRMPGYDIVTNSGFILATLEPYTAMYNRTCYKVHIYADGIERRQRNASNIHQALKQITRLKAGLVSYMITKYPQMTTHNRPASS